METCENDFSLRPPRPRTSRPTRRFAATTGEVKSRARRIISKGWRFSFREKRKSMPQNAKVNKTWWAKVNKFADMTDLEYRSLLGYRRVIRPGSSKGIIRGSSFLQMDAIAESRDWRKLNSSGFLRVQGGCGSCWAVAATGALEMHAEIHQNQKQKLSFSAVVGLYSKPGALWWRWRLFGCYS